MGPGVWGSKHSLLASNLTQSYSRNPYTDTTQRHKQKLKYTNNCRGTWDTSGVVKLVYKPNLPTTNSENKICSLIQHLYTWKSLEGGEYFTVKAWLPANFTFVAATLFDQKEVLSGSGTVVHELLQHFSLFELFRLGVCLLN